MVCLLPVAVGMSVDSVPMKVGTRSVVCVAVIDATTNRNIEQRGKNYGVLPLCRAHFGQRVRATKGVMSLLPELARQTQKVAEHSMPIFCQNRFRVKLDAISWMAGVSKAHDFTCIRMRRHG